MQAQRSKLLDSVDKDQDDAMRTYLMSESINLRAPLNNMEK